MKIHHDFSSFKEVKNPVLTIGTFDGVHLGHQALLNRMKTLAQEVNGETVVLTFTPHPRTVLFPEDHGIQLLSDTQEKRKFLDDCGIDHLVEFPFTMEFAKKSAFEYVRDLLVVGMNVHTVIVGYDHRFGRNREGNFQLLLEYADMFQFHVEEIPAQLINESEVSSTKIRNAISVGNVEFAMQATGRNYLLSGTVVHGKGNGQKIGFPTANIKISDPLKLIPANGVYVVETNINGKNYRGAMNIGTRPTFELNGSRSLEVHVIGFHNNLYEQPLQVEFIRKLRDEQNFGSIDALKEQLAKDIANAIR
ncbi:MAG: bifunctional riboflavin kinase/FAD synthetase [Flavobacteriales bacterium]|nr:bifunctional riboflavin kinase/FAD synthetase [Flavobacteriales bacterium]MDP4717088.1 bifunctional riboflavin kinase/FAD synthetase [Flavobacteriales bacterium]MDP4731710.1 bifunctional riboflavin kinase/FAD synthetase [Flavobacteriales bacterium]MDP4819082.1 bifunctional riboflavin kinase/FAD synthetase [Flavobacteriales bacterium]MDP4951587.1 bifunctional riboflavin kinase/FAD synthetase [Flavobacteriales bacterium]